MSPSPAASETPRPSSAPNQLQNAFGLSCEVQPKRGLPHYHGVTPWDAVDVLVVDELSVCDLSALFYVLKYRAKQYASTTVPWVPHYDSDDACVDGDELTDEPPELVD